MFSRFKLPRPPDNDIKVVKKTKHFRRRSLVDNKNKNDSCFISKNVGHFAKNYPQLKKSKDAVHLIEDIVDHAGIYLNKEEDFELVFSLEEKLMKGTLFSIDVYEESGDICVDDIYLISSTGEDN